MRRTQGSLPTPTKINCYDSLNSPTPEAWLQAETVAGLIEEGISLSLMPVAMVVRGVEPPTIEIVREAYLRLIKPISGTADDVMNAVDAATQHIRSRVRRVPLLQHWSRHARNADGRKRGALLNLMTVLADMGATAEDEPDRQQTHLVATALRITASQARFVVILAKNLTPNRLRLFATYVTMDELLYARQQVLSVLKHGVNTQPPIFGAAGWIILGQAWVNNIIQSPPGSKDFELGSKLNAEVAATTD